MNAKIIRHRMARTPGPGHVYRHGNSEAPSHPSIRDTRHMPHPRGGNHRLQHGRDGNPKG